MTKQSVSDASVAVRTSASRRWKPPWPWPWLRRTSCSATSKAPEQETAGNGAQSASDAASPSVGRDPRRSESETSARSPCLSGLPSQAGDVRESRLAFGRQRRRPGLLQEGAGDLQRGQGRPGRGRHLQADRAARGGDRGHRRGRGRETFKSSLVHARHSMLLLCMCISHISISLSLYMNK